MCFNLEPNKKKPHPFNHPQQNRGSKRHRTHPKPEVPQRRAEGTAGFGGATGCLGGGMKVVGRWGWIPGMPGSWWFKVVTFWFPIVEGQRSTPEKVTNNHYLDILIPGTSAGDLFGGWLSDPFGKANRDLQIGESKGHIESPGLVFFFFGGGGKFWKKSWSWKLV